MSSVDVSAGTGPSVNELEFVVELCLMIGKRATILLPKPKYSVSGLPKDNCIFSTQMTREEKGNYILHTIKQVKNAKKAIKRTVYDMVVFRLGSLPYSQYVIAKELKKKKIPYVLKTAGPNMLSAFAKKKSVVGKIMNYFHQKWVHYIVENASMCDCVSEIHYEGLKKVFPNLNVSIVDNSVNVKRFYPYSKEQARKKMLIDDAKFIVGYAGNFPYIRGAKQLVDIADRLVKRNSSIRFVALGAGTGYEELVSLSKKNNVDQYCIFPGVVKFDSVPDWINTFDVGISFLEHKSAGASEQKIRQYLACGVPVVCSYGSSSFVEEEGIGKTSEYDDLKAIFDNILFYLEMNDQEYKAVSDKCRQYAIAHLSTEASVKKRLSIWGAII